MSFTSNFASSIETRTWNYQGLKDSCNDAAAARTSKNPMGLISKTTTLHVHHAFLYISLPSLHGYDVKLPNSVFCGEHKQATTKFNFGLLNLNMVPWNSTSGGLAKI